MLLLEGVNDQKNGGRIVSLTHTVKKSGTGVHATHTISFYVPQPLNGPLAGELVARYVLTDEQARELKAHL